MSHNDPQKKFDNLFFSFWNISDIKSASFHLTEVDPAIFVSPQNPMRCRSLRSRHPHLLRGVVRLVRRGDAIRTAHAFAPDSDPLGACDRGCGERPRWADLRERFGSILGTVEATHKADFQLFVGARTKEQYERPMLACVFHLALGATIAILGHWLRWQTISQTQIIQAGGAKALWT